MYIAETAVSEYITPKSISHTAAAVTAETHLIKTNFKKSGLTDPAAAVCMNTEIPPNDTAAAAAGRSSLEPLLR